MTQTPGEHLEEEPQEERGPVGSRDTGSDEPSGGPVDRPAGGADAEADTSIEPQTHRDAGAPTLQSGDGPPAEDTVSDPDRPDGIDTGGSTVPPYPGRRATADVAGSGRAERDDATVGGASRPTEDPDQRATDGDTTDAATGSPADEQPADRAPQTAPDDEGVGPAHQPGTPRAEDQS